MEETNNLAFDIFNNIKIIGNHDSNDEDYSKLLDIIRGIDVSDYLDNNIFIFIVLVEIAKRWKDDENNEDEGGYWDYVFKVIYGDVVNQRVNHIF